MTTGKYLTASKSGGGDVLLANGIGDSDWETFKVSYQNDIPTLHKNSVVGCETLIIYILWIVVEDK